jgi:hypothetical protein
MRWTRYVATRERNTFKAWQKSAKEGHNLEEPGAVWNLKTCDRKMWTGFIWLKMETTEELL